jgi:hypothetical protein
MNRGILFSSIVTAGLLAVGCNAEVPGELSTSSEAQFWGCPAIADGVPVAGTFVPAATALGWGGSSDLAQSVAHQTLIARSFMNQNVHSGVFGPDTNAIATNDVVNRAAASNTASSVRNNPPVAIAPLTGGVVATPFNPLVGPVAVGGVDGVAATPFNPLVGPVAVGAATLPVVGLGASTDFLNNNFATALDHHAIATSATHSGVFGPDALSQAATTDFARSMANTTANATRVGAGIGGVGVAAGIPGDGVAVAGAAIPGIGLNSTDSLVNHADQSQLTQTAQSHALMSGVFGPDTSDTALANTVATANSFFQAAATRNGTPFGVFPGTPLAPAGTAALTGLVGVNTALGCGPGVGNINGGANVVGSPF